MPDWSGSKPCARAPPSDCRRMPTASISSMKTMHWPPHLRASFLARRASTRTTIASMPMNVAAKPEPGIEMKGELNPVAIAFASIVLPVPGAPNSRSPRSRLPPARSKWSPDCQMSTTRRTSSFASVWPRTSSSLTPHSASPGSNDCICDRFIISSGPNMIAKFAKKRKKTKTACTHSVGLVSRMSDRVPHRPDRAEPRAADEEPGDRDRDDEEQRDLEPEAPEPRATATDDVGLAQRALSTPKRLGHGISFRKMRSAKPRKTMTIARAASSDVHQLQPFCCENQTNSAGAVITATTVATRVSRRHERASSSEASPEGRLVNGTVVTAKV